MEALASWLARPLWEPEAGTPRRRVGNQLVSNWVGVGPDLWAAPPPGLRPGISPLEWLPPWVLAWHGPAWPRPGSGVRIGQCGHRSMGEPTTWMQEGSR